MTFRTLLLLFFGFAASQSIRLAWAEAAQRRKPPDPETALRLSLERNPRLSTAWIEQGIRAERTGNFRQAEASLLEAARIDHLYLPAWTLANYYFRRGDAERFWPWAERAASLTFDDYRPLLRLCDELDSDPPAVIARLGGSRAIIRAYLDLLIGEQHSAQKSRRAQQVAQLLLAQD